MLRLFNFSNLAVDGLCCIFASEKSGERERDLSFFTTFLTDLLFTQPVKNNPDLPVYTQTIKSTKLFNKMKTSQAVINFKLNSQRVNKQGLTPVVLRISFKQKRISKNTGIYVPENQWDTKNQRIRAGLPDSGKLNEQLFEIKSYYLKRLDELVQSGRSYTVDDLVSDKPVVKASSTLSEILEDMIVFKGLSHNTAMAYRASVRRLSEAGVEKLSEISPEGVQGLCKRLKAAGLSDSSVNSTMSCLGSIWKYCVTRGYCSGELFSKCRFWKKYRINQKHRSLDKKLIGQLLNWFVSKVAVVDQFNGLWTYSPASDLSNRNSVECCVAMCLMGYYCRGLAFCDLVRIKSDNISVKEIDGVEYYCISGLNRKKTNVVIPDIFIERDDDMSILFEWFIHTMPEREDYLLPVLGGYGYKGDKQLSEATGTCSVNMNKKLRIALKEIGYEDVDEISYYSFRHSFASHYMAANNSNPVFLATMMARSVNGIFRYVRSIESAEDTIRETSKVFGKKTK